MQKIAADGRPSLSGYKRDFAMPDHLHIETEIGALSSARQRRATSTVETDVVLHSAESPEREAVADSLLSKHNGWITIDSEKANRKMAPEAFQSTNPLQRERIKPYWMR